MGKGETPELIPQPEAIQEADQKLVADLGLVTQANKKYFPQDLANLYTIYEYRHAAVILKNEFPSEFDDICHALRTFRFTDEQVRKPGGNESEIPKTISDQLR